MSNVVFPEPDGPIKHTFSPFDIFKFIPFSTLTSELPCK